MRSHCRNVTILAVSLAYGSAIASPLNASGAIQQGDLMRMFSGLLLVLLIIVLLSLCIKKLQSWNVGSVKGFKTLAHLTLGSKERIILVKTGTRYLLLGVTSGSINVLCDYGEQMPEGFELGEQSKFVDILKNVQRKIKR